ncbi:hypothetical protein [uncultured Dysosmobacter sp.]|uniref:hypothetical protein n=1 Tax=uncultured Dysosmobacter sp. TaxID=2591384 RepID=UPI0026284D8C|nr:hypothetical protein [uncultured Dysosmobacter sp.]
MNTRPSEAPGAARQRVLNRRAATRRITCCEDDRLPKLLGGKVLHIKNGVIEG